MSDVRVEFFPFAQCLCTREGASGYPFRPFTLRVRLLLARVSIIVNRTFSASCCAGSSKGCPIVRSARARQSSSHRMSSSRRVRLSDAKPLGLTRGVSW